jgi:FixJ family two-component response regulator
MDTSPIVYVVDDDLSARSTVEMLRHAPTLFTCQKYQLPNLSNRA